jgi:hypothetical protein
MSAFKGDGCAELNWNIKVVYLFAVGKKVKFKEK